MKIERKITVLVRKKDTDADRLPISVLQDNKISFEAKGCLALIFSFPDGWHFRLEELAKYKTDKPSKLISILKELEKSGYLSKEEHKTLSTHSVNYTLFEAWLYK